MLVLHDDLTLIHFDVLANIYNMEKLEVETRTVTVDNFNEEGCWRWWNIWLIAGLFDVRAFRLRVLNHMETFRNPQTLTTKHFLHMAIMSIAYLFNMVYFVVPEGSLDLSENGGE